jgi:serine/threonine-protein kinase
MSVATAEDFLALLVRSQLVSREQLVALQDEIAPMAWNDPARLADELSSRGLITSWQAQQLLAGHHRFVFGKYKLLDQIGLGGMGAVYKAEMTAMGRIVALKIMSRELLKNAEAIARFKREVKAVSSLNHPNVVAAYDAVCEGQTYCLVMEYVDGGNLNQWLKQWGPLPFGWASECIRQAALGLQHVHEEGIVHRDIKPGNLLVAAESPHKLPVVKVLDMGLARMDSPEDSGKNLTRQGQVLGTPDYIAPEQAHDTRAADARCDIYSLGVTLYKMLTGELPFAGKTAMEKILARTQTPAPRVSELRPDIPPGLDDVIAKMLATDPRDRYQTAWEVAQALMPYSLAARLSRAAQKGSRTSSIMTAAFSEMLLQQVQAGQVEAIPAGAGISMPENPRASRRARLVPDPEPSQSKPRSSSGWIGALLLILAILAVLSVGLLMVFLPK